MKKLYFKWHRQLAIIVGIPVILWALSGILHPMMSHWFKADIANKFIPPTPLSTQGIKAPAEILPPSLKLSFLKLIKVGEKTAYLTQNSNQEFAIYNASNGIPIDLNVYLEAQARAYLDDSTSDFKKTERIDQFNNTYSMINRYLPAYRVILDREDGMEVVIDPRTGKMARFDAPHIRTMKHLFGWFHTYSFLGKTHSIFRITIVSILAFLAFSLGITGLINLFLFKAKNTQGIPRKMSHRKRAHRILGACAFLFYFLFSLSALFHILKKTDYDHSPQMKYALELSPTQLQVAPQSTTPVSSVTLAKIDGTPHYRLASRQGVHYQYATKNSSEQKQKTPAKVDFEALYLQELTRHFTQEIYGESVDVASSEHITTFSQSYGFIFRRLPVWKQTLDNGESLHIDTQDNAVAKHGTLAGMIEGISFSMLHKFHFIDNWNKEARDWISATGASMVAAVGILGLSLLLKRKKT